MDNDINIFNVLNGGYEEEKPKPQKKSRKKPNKKSLRSKSERPSARRMRAAILQLMTESERRQARRRSVPPELEVDE